ncbi:MAG: hypothetical protein FJ308_13335 [Planctomycetes bacterium]|nr:hypothetical protein [Planctomycetota bacterium]
MATQTRRYGIAGHDRESIRSSLELALSLNFEERDSFYLGSYLNDISDRFDECNIVENRDPLWIPGDDPDDEKYFEATAKDCDYLLTITDTPEIIKLHPAIIDSVGGIRIVRDDLFDGG